MKNKTYCIAFMMCWIANKIVTNIHRLLIGFYQGILSGFRVTFILTESISGFISTTLFTLVASIECILTNHGIVECLLEYTARDEIKCHADIIYSHRQIQNMCDEFYVDRADIEAWTRDYQQNLPSGVQAECSSTERVVTPSDLYTVRSRKSTAGPYPFSAQYRSAAGWPQFIWNARHQSTSLPWCEGSSKILF